MSRSKKAFTLIELLVVIAIIGLLATISVLALQNARAKSRDAKRVADTKQLQTALELFFNDNNRYPTIEEWNTGKIYSTTTGATSTYMQVVPNAPTPSDGSCTEGQNSIGYIPTEEGASYAISFCLGNTTGTLSSGPKCLTPGGVIDVDCSSDTLFSCPGIATVNYSNPNYSCDSGNGDTCVYNTVKIGNQCWLRQNLNVGTSVAGNVNQANNAVVEKYCYNDTAGNCTAYGGLYQWNEAMQYSVSEGVQGICPNGWHIPTDAEWSTLETYLTDSPNACTAGRVGSWECANAGTKLKVGGSSGFDDKLAGHRYTSGSFYNQGVVSIMWSSSVNGTETWLRDLNLSYQTVYRFSDIRADGFSVRCLMD